jgi:alkylhydroperoxidase family enzyme
VSGWAPADRALVDFADELCRTDDVTDPTWAALADRYDEAQLVELLVLGGYYRMVSGILNGARVPREDGVPGWPSR